MHHIKLSFAALLIAFVPLNGFSGFFWDKPDPDAVKLVTQHFELMDCRDEQHYILGLRSRHFSELTYLHALDLGSNYTASDHLSYSERDVSKVQRKNGIEKKYFWEFELDEVPYKSARVFKYTDYDAWGSEIDNKKWESREFTVQGIVSLVNGKWEVEILATSDQPWFGHWNDKSLRACEIFGL